MEHYEQGLFFIATKSISPAPLDLTKFAKDTYLTIRNKSYKHYRVLYIISQEQRLENVSTMK
jgi:hypothetical protein